MPQTQGGYPASLPGPGPIIGGTPGGNPDRTQINRNSPQAYFFTPQAEPYPMPNVYTPGMVVQGGIMGPSGPMFPTFPFNQGGVDNQVYGGRDPAVAGAGDPQLAWLRQNSDDARYQNGLPRDPRYSRMRQNSDDYRFPSGVPMPGARGNVYGLGLPPYGTPQAQKVPDWSSVIGGDSALIGLVMLPGVGFSK